MFGIFDLPGGIRLRMTRPSDRLFERKIHDANRQDLHLIGGEAEYVQSIFDLQFRARDQGYGEQYPNAQYYMIEKSGNVAGRLVVDFGHNEVRIIDISLLPACHNQGIGTRVITALQNVAGKIAASLALSVRRDNPAGIGLYQKLGFAPDPENPPGAMHLHLVWRPGRDTMGERTFIQG